MAELKRFPSVSWFAHPWSSISDYHLRGPRFNSHEYRVWNRDYSASWGQLGHSIRTGIRDSLAFFCDPNSECTCHEMMVSSFTPCQVVLHSNKCNGSAVTISMYYDNSSTNYLTTNGYGVRVCFENSNKNIWRNYEHFKMYHLSCYHFFWVIFQ